MVDPFDCYHVYPFQKTFFIYGDIFEDLYNYIIDDLEKALNPLINVDNVPVTIYISSTGGSLSYASKIANVIFNSPIQTIAYGFDVMSSAVVIFCACRTRYVYKNSHHNILLHAIRVECNNRLTKGMIDNLRNEIELYANNLVNILANRTLLSPRYLYYILYNDSDVICTFTDEELLSIKIVTDILED